MIKKIAMSVAALLVLTYLGFWLAAPGTGNPAQYQALAGDYDVRIVRDRFGVPHIFGERDVDVAFGLAFAHAEDDFATIQDVVLATRGKLSTLHGPDAAKTDYLIQWMDVWSVVDAGYESRISQATRDHAEAYAAGLNFYVSENPDGLAPGLLPFTGKDIVAGFTFKTPLFYGFDQVVAKVAEGEYGTGLDKVASLMVTDAPQPELGSQGVAIAPERSGDGATRLLVNSHQPLTGPVAWYEARVKSGEGWDMAGGTFPGSPIILHGTGPTLGWANTVNKPDLVDVYQLTLNPENANQYKLDGEWRDFEIEDATIDVTFWGPIRWTFREPIYRSAHGPVFKSEKGAFAVRWAGMNEMRTLEEMIALNKARSRHDFEAALAMMAMPSINYVYADKAGNIAHYYNAMMPKRPEGVDWSSLVPGDRSDLIWQGYHAFRDIPKTVNPPSGAVFNANNSPFVATDGDGGAQPADYPSTMGVETRMTNRALRLRELLTDAEQVYDHTFQSIKYDNAYSFRGEEKSVAFTVWHEVTGLEFEDPALEEARDFLFGWSLTTDASNDHAALGVLTVKPFIMADMRGEPRPDLRQAFEDAVKLLKDNFGRLDVPWGQVNRLVRGNESWPLSGGPDVLRAVYGEWNDDAGHLEATAGDSYIMFVEWGEDGAQHVRTVHNFGSATLDASSPHYADQAPLFASGRERVLPLDMVALEQEKTSERRLGGAGN
ncbi:MULTISPECIES: penicillin acylase family protein [Kordiimonas]|jgi:penicillin amidase/acyl-homoserine-lactone acylase|uniref:penicillin acylase family protein n=1 Tax=Kordiimonas TaxID=288021 RepID=UPI00257CD2FF|nr:penicillin acylase family protein [Kordiimonas sp. UBA4487]